MNESSPDEPEMIPGTEGESKGVTDMEGSPVPAKAPEDRPADSMPLADGAGEPAEERTATIYWLILTVLFVGAIVLRRFPFDDNEARHVIWEFISTTLALVVGALSLVRFYSKKQETFLFIGTGFLGTGLLNGYHAFTTSAFIGAGGAAGLETADAAAWTWTASRLFLSMFLFGSVFLWSDESESGRSHVNELTVYVLAAVLTTAFFLVFTFFPLPPAYYPEFNASRPAEFIPGIFFFAAWVGYLHKGDWRTEPFQYWLLISLMISVFLHLMYMSQATSEFDAIADAAHFLKIAANVSVLAGLMISVFVTFRSETAALETVYKTNLAMAREVEVRAKAEHRLRDFLDNANDLIQITDAYGSLSYVNRAWTATFGFEEEDVEGKNVYSLLRPSNRVELETAFQRLTEGGSMERFISEFHTRDGVPVICAISANCSRTGEDVMVVRSIIRNVTETVEAERELAGSRANLNALVENTDLHMPDLDGWEVLRRLKADPDVRHIPVVIASIAANEGRGRLFGAVDLLTKPMERSDLLRVLWRQLVNQHGRRVLLVDDDPEIQALLTTALAVDDLDVHCVENGEEALLFLERYTPAAVLLDLRMPVMDGFEFLDRMRESRYHKGLPVIAITVKRLSAKEEAQLADKASAVVIKDDNFVPRIRAFLTTLFPMESRTIEVEPIAD